jgi:hypothetical protein
MMTPRIEISVIRLTKASRALGPQITKADEELVVHGFNISEQLRPGAEAAETE